MVTFQQTFMIIEKENRQKEDGELKLSSTVLNNAEQNDRKSTIYSK